ncbi:MAG: pteridine reductase [Lysobacterales bacterium]
MSESRPAALVTGSARRIGAAIARRLHAAGFDLALHYRDSAGEAQALAAELESARAGSVVLLQADLAQFDRLPELVAKAVGRFGRLDALVNNASAFYPTPFGATTPAQWDELFAINARAPFFLAQAAAPHLASANGAIVNIADIYAERPLRGHAVYAMGKAALLQMTRALALELAPQVRVNAVSPGAILWPENGKDPEAQSALLARTPLGRIGTPGEIAEAVRWLLQDARYCTGQVLRVDGGRMLDA